ncbi:MAG: TonB-dependent receptor [Flavobacteriaceae bacterium]|nr:TonB-dependent receptor [Flavobacteriaceae bacterium]
MKNLLLIAIVILFTITVSAQTVVTGNVKDVNTGEPLPGVNIKVVDKSLGTSTDFDGNYVLKVEQEPPFDIEITILGYAKQVLNVTSKTQTTDVLLVENASALDEVIVSASRTPESVRESPVTVERMDARDIANTASASFYNSIENLKGVDVNTSSLTFNSVNTRGFATFANTRFVQLIDGMDNASPALNFVMGNLLGINELDVKSVELLPGASSALYGANAFNGILFMTSKNPFDNQGISAYVKKGITSSEAGRDDAYTDVGIRAAHAFSEKFAVKASFSYLDGTDWVANDTNSYSNLNVAGEADEITPLNSSANHDGLNIYGDEINSAAALGPLGITMENLAASGGAPVPEGTIGTVSRTGYLESELTDYEAKSVKTDVSLNYRPFGNDLEIVGNYRVGFGNTIYQGANRYQLKDFRMGQLKLEIRNDDFFLRAYKTVETAGDSYDMRFTGINLSKIDAGTWFGTYAAVFGQNWNANGNNADLAHAAAREFADENVTLQPGTPEFETAFNQIISNPDVSQGSKFIDNTSMNVGEGNYNFKSLLNDALDLQVGGSYRQYSLNSGGTIFTDYDGPIEYNEYGAYVQASKKFIDDRLKITASARMDKNEFFDAAISPRASINYAVDEGKKHNFRASFQTGFRNPTTQDLFIGFNVGRAILVGSSPENLDRDLPNTNLTGDNAYNNAYSASSFSGFINYLQTDDFANEVASYMLLGNSQAVATSLATQDNFSRIEATKTELVQPEKVTALDIGYRGKLGKISVDLNGYYNIYDGFISLKNVISPVNGSALDGTGYADVGAALPHLVATGGGFDTNFLQPFQTYTNSNADVISYGAVIGLSTRVGDGYRVGLNFTYAKFDFDQASDPDFRAGFNTPEMKVNFSVGNNNVFNNFGFNINTRWQDEFLWESSIANALVESRFVADAMLNYSMPKWKSTFKIGGTNIGGIDYRSAPGAGNIGSQYFVSWTINN